MKWTLVALDDVAPQPWRNGGGRTRELLAWPTPADWRVRISVADVEAPGPFSRFEGSERWFAVLQGAGVVLDIAGTGHQVTPASAPLQFDGAAAVECRLLDGATRDLNLMAAPGCARMRRVQGALAFATTRPALLAVYAHGQPARITQDHASFAVPALHLAWALHDHGAAVRIDGEHAFWMEARP
jgi:uncharacterized protein